ncbi:winged helix-turn-helix domain-containing protein [Streptomyces sp. NPDC096132]|uniref:winged helix-turn-helix domain-containing protein n=1 Tax=Streptomyces sp. NPDC096132 TaxID=3366075 RepID=UPI0038241BB1
MNDLIPTARVVGKIRYHNEDLYGKEVDPIEVRRRIGMVFQKPNPFPKSIYDNIAYGPRVGGFRGNLDDLVEETLTHAALWDEVKDKLKTSALALSGGQQQRLCIARTIAVKMCAAARCSEPDPDLAKKAVARFSRAGLRTLVCHDGAEALLLLGDRKPHAVMLSTPLPVVDAARVTELIAKLHPVPVIAGPEDTVEATAALTAGAVALVARPYRIREIIPLLRGTRPADGSEYFLVVGDIELDTAGFHVYVRGRPEQLTVRELLLLRYLTERPNKVISRPELTQALWGTSGLHSNTLTVHIRRLRTKVCDEAGSRCTIDAIRGIGYRLESDPAAAKRHPDRSSLAPGGQ